MDYLAIFKSSGEEGLRKTLEGEKPEAFIKMIIEQCKRDVAIEQAKIHERQTRKTYELGFDIKAPDNTKDFDPSDNL